MGTRATIVLVLVLTFAVAALGWFVWPTRFEYVEGPAANTTHVTATVLYRIDRLTGRTWMLERQNPVQPTEGADALLSKWMGEAEAKPLSRWVLVAEPPE